MITGAVIQARMGSTRLPGKMAMSLCGEPVLAHVIRRVRAAEKVDVVCVATTTRDRDDLVVEIAELNGAEFFRGDEPDVLKRYADTARYLNLDLVVRVTGDCPLHDPGLLDEMLEARECVVDDSGPVDYYSNCLKRTYPRGLDTEIVPARTLYLADEEAESARDREHVTPFIWSQPARFRLVDHVNRDGDWSSYRWTIDYELDFKMVQRIYDFLYRENPEFDRYSIIKLIEAHPEIAAINTHIEQKQLSEL